MNISWQWEGLGKPNQQMNHRQSDLNKEQASLPILVSDEV
jgi:hypothetical protein